MPAFFEGRAEGSLHEVAFLGPGHVHGCGVAVVEGLVLGSHGVDFDAFLFKGFNPFHEILGVILIVFGIELA